MRKLPKGLVMPRDVFEFMENNTPSIITKLLQEHIRTLEEERDTLLKYIRTLQEEVIKLHRFNEEFDERLTRVEGKRVMTKPVNTVAKSGLKQPRKPRNLWYKGLSH